jgi:hypothetical protein
MLSRNPAEFYHGGFFDNQSVKSLASAKVIAPLVCDLIQPRRVVDVGCGRGAWLSAFSECGVDLIHGLDGEYVGRDTLVIPLASFTPTSLDHLTELPGAYDLAICLEVLEHLSPRSGANVVAALTRAAPVVLFSAAIPGQGGTGHVNEQWPEYWCNLFAGQGFRFLDPIRPRIREDRRVRFWYRQNILMFASDAAIAANEKLAAEAAREPQPELQWVHISMVRKDHSAKAFMGRVSRALPVRLTRHLKGPIKAALGWGHAR